MKKWIVFFVVILSIGIGACSCGLKEKKYYKQYVEAIANNNFGDARCALAMLEQEDVDLSDINSKKLDLYQKEILYLVAKDELAAAKLVLEELHQCYLKETKRFCNETFDNKANVYYGAQYKLFSMEINALFNDKQTSFRSISALLREIPNDGERVRPGLCDYSVARLGKWGDEGTPLYRYKRSCEEYNKLCDYILSLAIQTHNKSLAKDILSLYKENVIAIERGSDVKYKGVKVDGNHGYIDYDYAAKQEAQKKYNEAIREGLL